MRKPLITGKWASRKLWATIAGGVLIILNEVYGFGIDENAYWAILGLVGSYVFGEAWVDGRRSQS